MRRFCLGLYNRFLAIVAIIPKQNNIRIVSAYRRNKIKNLILLQVCYECPRWASTVDLQVPRLVLRAKKFSKNLVESDEVKKKTLARSCNWTLKMWRQKFFLSAEKKFDLEWAIRVVDVSRRVLTFRLFSSFSSW